MKKLIIGAFISIILMGIASCSKTSCTDHTAPNYGSSGSCTDLTTGLVGTYSGTFYDSAVGNPGIYTTSQTVTVTKIDDSQIQFTPSNTSSFYSFTATLSSVGGSILLTIPSQSSGGATIIGYAASGNNGYSGTFNPSTKLLGTTISSSSSGTLSYESFAGMHQ